MAFQEFDELFEAELDGGAVHAVDGGAFDVRIDRGLHGGVELADGRDVVPANLDVSANVAPATVSW